MSHQSIHIFVFSQKANRGKRSQFRLRTKRKVPPARVFRNFNLEHHGSKLPLISTQTLLFIFVPNSPHASSAALCFGLMKEPNFVAIETGESVVPVPLPPVIDLLQLTHSMHE